MNIEFEYRYRDGGNFKNTGGYTGLLVGGIMKAPLICIFLLAAAGSIPLFNAQESQAQAQKTETAEDAVRRVNAEEIQAFRDKDAKAMARLWSDDFVVTNPLNKFVNKGQVLGMVQSGFLVTTSYDRQIEYLKIYGDIAIVAGIETLTWGGRMPDAGKTEQLRFTGIWRQQQGQWQEIARHANILPKQ
jgi:ketosteroid isomerase-like protein